MVIGPLLIVGLVSVASVETTGKGLADHTISTMRDQDCKISRSISGNDICRPATPEPRATVTVSPPTAPQVVKPGSSVHSMEDVFNQRRNRANQKVDQKFN
jgi:archaeosine-15-forming tRNA-guanine transglycosylase